MASDQQVGKALKDMVEVLANAMVYNNLVKLTS